MFGIGSPTPVLRASTFLRHSSFVIRYLAPFVIPLAPRPVKPPLPPMEAKSVDEIPVGEEWQYEPKWDGFRCIAFRNGDDVYLQSKGGQPLARYFPDVVAAIAALNAKRFAIDGELVIEVNG